MRQKRFYVRYDIIVNYAKVGWGEEVVAHSKLEVKHFIEEKYKDNPTLKIVNIWEEEYI